MKNILLPGLLMAIAFNGHAKEELVSKAPKLSLPSYSGDRHRVHFFWGFQLGLDKGKMKVKDSTAKGGGFMGQFEMGTKIELPTKFDTKAALLTVSAAYMSAKLVNRVYTFAQVPLSYTSLGLGPDGESRGFYWQAGINVNYLAGVEKFSTPAVDAAYNRVLLDPTFGFGLNAPFRLVAGRGGPEVAHGRVSVGLAFSYCVMNMMKNDASMHNYMVGLRYQYIFM